MEELDTIVFGRPVQLGMRGRGDRLTVEPKRGNTVHGPHVCACPNCTLTALVMATPKDDAKNVGARLAVTRCSFASLVLTVTSKYPGSCILAPSATGKA